LRSCASTYAETLEKCGMKMPREWRSYRREAVGKRLLNAAGKISGGEQLASIGKHLYKFTA